MVTRKSKRKPAENVSARELVRGYRAFRRKERRDAMYKTATFLVAHFWGKSSEIANSLGVLLLTWNQAHYRYGSFDFQALERVLTTKQPQLESFRHRDVLTYASDDDQVITSLFNELLTATRICEGERKGAKSPVAVAKALHLLAPSYFPLWDRKIADAYGCNYARQPAAKYLVFLRAMKRIVEGLMSQGVVRSDATRTFLKVLDEYNYAKYTKGWI